MWVIICLDALDGPLSPPTNQIIQLYTLLEEASHQGTINLILLSTHIKSDTAYSNAYPLNSFCKLPVWSLVHLSPQQPLPSIYTQTTIQIAFKKQIPIYTNRPFKFTQNRQLVYTQPLTDTTQKEEVFMAVNGAADANQKILLLMAGQEDLKVSCNYPKTQSLQLSELLKNGIHRLRQLKELQKGHTLGQQQSQIMAINSQQAQPFNPSNIMHDTVLLTSQPISPNPATMTIFPWSRSISSLLFRPSSNMNRLYLARCDIPLLSPNDSQSQLQSSMSFMDPSCSILAVQLSLLVCPSIAVVPHSVITIPIGRNNRVKAWATKRGQHVISLYADPVIKLNAETLLEVVRKGTYQNNVINGLGSQLAISFILGQVFLKPFANTIALTKTYKLIRLGFCHPFARGQCIFDELGQWCLGNCQIATMELASNVRQQIVTMLNEVNIQVINKRIEGLINLSIFNSITDRKKYARQVIQRLSLIKEVFCGPQMPHIFPSAANSNGFSENQNTRTQSPTTSPPTKFFLSLPTNPYQQHSILSLSPNESQFISNPSSAHTATHSYFSTPSRSQLLVQLATSNSFIAHGVDFNVFGFIKWLKLTAQQQSNGIYPSIPKLQSTKQYITPFSQTQPSININQNESFQIQYASMLTHSLSDSINIAKRMKDKYERDKQIAVSHGEVGRQTDREVRSIFGGWGYGRESSSVGLDSSPNRGMRDNSSASFMDTLQRSLTANTQSYQSASFNPLNFNSNPFVSTFPSHEPIKPKINPSPILIIDHCQLCPSLVQMHRYIRIIFITRLKRIEIEGLTAIVVPNGLLRDEMIDHLEKEHIKAKSLSTELLSSKITVLHHYVAIKASLYKLNASQVLRFAYTLLLPRLLTPLPSNRLSQLQVSLPNWQLIYALPIYKQNQRLFIKEGFLQLMALGEWISQVCERKDNQVVKAYTNEVLKHGLKCIDNHLLVTVLDALLKRLGIEYSNGVKLTNERLNFYLENTNGVQNGSPIDIVDLLHTLTSHPSLNQVQSSLFAKTISTNGFDSKVKQVGFIGKLTKLPNNPHSASHFKSTQASFLNSTKYIPLPTPTMSPYNPSFSLLPLPLPPIASDTSQLMSEETIMGAMESESLLASRTFITEKVAPTKRDEHFIIDSLTVPTYYVLTKNDLSVYGVREEGSKENYSNWQGSPNQSSQKTNPTLIARYFGNFIFVQQTNGIIYVVEKLGTSKLNFSTLVTYQGYQIDSTMARQPIEQAIITMPNLSVDSMHDTKLAIKFYLNSSCMVSLSNDNVHVVAWRANGETGNAYMTQQPIGLPSGAIAPSLYEFKVHHQILEWTVVDLNPYTACNNHFPSQCFNDLIIYVTKNGLIGEINVNSSTRSNHHQNNSVTALPNCPTNINTCLLRFPYFCAYCSNHSLTVYRFDMATNLRSNSNLQSSFIHQTLLSLNYLHTIPQPIGGIMAYWIDGNASETQKLTTYLVLGCNDRLKEAFRVWEVEMGDNSNNPMNIHSYQTSISNQTIKTLKINSQAQLQTIQLPNTSPQTIRPIFHLQPTLHKQFQVRSLTEGHKRQALMVCGNNYVKLADWISN